MEQFRYIYFSWIINRIFSSELFNIWNRINGLNDRMQHQNQIISEQKPNDIWKGTTGNGIDKFISDSKQSIPTTISALIF